MPKMAVTYLFFALLGLIAYFLAWKLRPTVRIALAVSVFLLPSVLFTLWAIHVGDKAPPGARTVDPSELAR